MAVFLPRAWRHQPQYPVNAGPEWRVAFNAATSPQSTDSTGVHWRLQGTTNDWLNRARVVLPPHGIAFQAEQFYGGDDSISGVHSGGAGYLFPREQGTMVVLGKVVTPFAYQPAIAVSNGALLRGDIDETWFQVGGNIWTTGQAWSTTMDGLFAVALTWGAFGRRLYRGGRLLASTSTAPSSTAHSGTLNVGGDGMRYWMCAISGDVLDAGALSENPWQVFRPRTARVYSFPSAAGGAIESGAGSSAGTSTASGVGASIAAGAGESDGAATASAEGASTAAAAGSAAGEATADGAGASIAAATGTSAGSATADGVGDSAESGVESGAGSAAGTSTATGVGASTAAAQGTSAGSATADATGASTAAGAGTSAGSATASGVGSTASAETPTVLSGRVETLPSINGVVTTLKALTGTVQTTPALRGEVTTYADAA